jgi:hypothetical protein
MSVKPLYGEAMLFCCEFLHRYPWRFVVTDVGETVVQGSYAILLRVFTPLSVADIMFVK